MNEIILQLDDVNIARTVFGVRDDNLAQIEKAFKVEILVRDALLTIRGPKKSGNAARSLIADLYELARKGFILGFADVTQAINIRQTNPKQSLANIFLDEVTLTKSHESVTPKTVTQKKYVDAMREHDVVFTWGPAGTGKTYLAMAMAVAALGNKQVERVILTRPADEAGEKLGFLPGDMAEKVNPYLRPLYDALHDMMELERVRKLLDRGVIEVAPLAFMRGRTLNKSYVILDEAQNTTPEQMKMFLTRLGLHSKAVITGDITQVDLPDGKRSGLVEVIDLLRSIREIAFVEFSSRDVVRHPIVQKIICAYEAANKAK